MIMTLFLNKYDEKNNRKFYLELLRSIAILLVIFNHTDGFFLYYTNTENSLTFAYSLLFSILCRVDVPLFFMISGALLLEKEESLSELFRKRILRIVLVILLFSFVHYMVALIRGKELSGSVFGFIRGILAGTIEETYWFLYAYLGMLLIVPFLRGLVRGMKQGTFRYLLVLEAVMAVMVPTGCSLSGITVSSSLFYLNNNVFYMLTGYALEHDKLQEGSVKKPWPVCAGVICCVIAEIVICCFRFRRSGVYLQSDLDLLVPVLAVFVFEAVRRLCSGRQISVSIRKIILLTGSCAFGIYLVEQFVRTLLLPIYLYLTEYTVGVVACTVYVLGTWLVSFVFVLVLKKLPGIRKLL